MKTAKKKSKTKKLKKKRSKPEFLGPGIRITDDWDDYDFDNDPVFKAKREKAVAYLRKYPPPGYKSEDFK